MAHVRRPAVPHPLLATIQTFLRARDVAGYLVGGSVRDGLLGRPQTDVDLAVEADALTLTRDLADALGGAYVPLHEGHRIARVVVRDAATGRPVTVDVGEAQGGIVADLLRRDFTVDALALPLQAVVADADWGALPLLDPTGGRVDLAAAVLRAVQPRVFQDDPLRLLRAVRLAAELRFTIAADTQAAIRRDAALLTTVAGERVREELCRILAAAGAAASVRRMDDLGLLDVLLPELTVGKGVSQPKEHAWDVFTHNVETVGWVEAILDREQLPAGAVQDLLALLPWAPEVAGHFQRDVAGGQRRSTLLKLAGLLHDVAKPQTKGPDATGRIRFLGHADLGADMAAAMLTRLRFGSREVQMVRDMITYHLRPSQLSTGWQLPTDRAVYRYFRDVGEVALDTLYLNLADHLAARGPNLEREEWEAHTALVAHILDRLLTKHQAVAPPRLITGHDVLAHFGIEPGPLVGRMVEAVREAQAAGEVSSRDEALAYLERWQETTGGESQPDV